MKNFIKNLFKKMIQKIVKKSETAEVEETVPVVEPEGYSKKALWKFIIQTLISILTAILTALGATSCIGIE